MDGKQLLAHINSLLNLFQKRSGSETDGTVNINQPHCPYRIPPRLFAVAAALGYIAFLNLFFEYAAVFEFNPDEGNNLIKTLLLDRGNLLGRQIWTDQPPGFTYLLWGVFKIFGWSVAVARQTVLFFAGIVVFVVYDVLRSSFKNHYGHPAAAAGCILLVLSALFIRLSVSVMIGLPAIALMMLAVWSLNEYLQSRRRWWLVICGALMGLSMGIKLFTGFLVPCYMIVLIFHHVKGERSGWWKRPVIPVILLLSGLLGALLICLSPMLLQGSFLDLFEPHLVTRLARKGDANGLRPLLRFIRQDGILFALALPGTILALKKLKTSMCLWILWLFPAIAVLYDHAPVWTHHRLLITAPGAILAGYALGEMMLVPMRKWPRVFQPAFLIFPVIAMAGFLVLHHAHLEERLLISSSMRDKSLRDEKALQVIESYLPDIQYMVSSRQIFAFRANRPVPPNLAVTSRKRLQSGLLTGNDIISEIREYRPEVVILNDRWKQQRAHIMDEVINADYELVFQDKNQKNLEVWILKTLVKKDPGGNIQ